MKGLLQLTTKEMVSSLSEACFNSYDRVSPPQYYQGEGPYLVAMVTDKAPWEIHLYEILDTKTFQSNPQGIAQAFRDVEFISSALASMEGDYPIARDSKISLQLRKIIPDTPACRLIVQKMYELAPLTATNIFFMTDRGSLFHSKDILAKPVQLN